MYIVKSFQYVYLINLALDIKLIQVKLKQLEVILIAIKRKMICQDFS